MVDYDSALIPPCCLQYTLSTLGLLIHDPIKVSQRLSMALFASLPCRLHGTLTPPFLSPQAASEGPRATEQFAAIAAAFVSRCVCIPNCIPITSRMYPPCIPLVNISSLNLKFKHVSPSKPLYIPCFLAHADLHTPSLTLGPHFVQPRGHLPVSGDRGILPRGARGQAG